MLTALILPSLIRLSVTPRSVAVIGPAGAPGAEGTPPGAAEPPEAPGVGVPAWPAAAFAPGACAAGALPGAAPADRADEVGAPPPATDAFGAPGAGPAAAGKVEAGAPADAVSDAGPWAVGAPPGAAVSPPGVEACGGWPGAAAVGTRLEPLSEQAAASRAMTVRAASTAPMAPPRCFSLALSFSFIVLLPPGEPAWNVATSLWSESDPADPTRGQA